MAKYLIGLGSNSDSDHRICISIIDDALSLLKNQGVRILKKSSWWESRAVPVGSGPNYINGVIEVSSSLLPNPLLSLLKRIEKNTGRRLGKRWAPREIDLDLLACGQMIYPSVKIFKRWSNLPVAAQKTTEPKHLIIPHPRIQDRLFVLLPLDEVCTYWTHPLFKKTASEFIHRKVWKRYDLLILR